MKNWVEEYVGKRCNITMKNVRDGYEDVTLLASDDQWIKVLNNKDIIFIRMEQITSIRILLK